MHSILECPYVAGVYDEGFRIIGSGMCGTISVDVPSEASCADPLVGMQTRLLGVESDCVVWKSSEERDGKKTHWDCGLDHHVEDWLVL